jgi:hypothetical protein
MLSVLALWTLDCQLRHKYMELGEQSALLESGAVDDTPPPDAFVHAPDESDVRTALFKTHPVEWNRQSHLQVGLSGH